MDRTAGEGRASRPESAPGTMTMQAHLTEIVGAAIAAADPREAVRAHLRLDGDQLTVTTLGGPVRVKLPASGQGRVVLVGAGKGSGPMAQAVEELLGDRLWGGLICVKDGHGCPTQRVEVVEASHPVPDERGLRAAERMLGSP